MASGSSDTVYAALDDRLLVVRERDGEWTAAETLVSHDLECVDASTERPDRVLVGTVDAGIRRTTDGGGSWERVSDIDDRVTAVTVSPHDPDVVWAGTEPSAVYRSSDGGETWIGKPGIADLPSSDRWSFPPRPHTHHVRWIEVDPFDHDRLYVAIEAGALVRTEDGGDTWQDRPEGSRRDNHTLATHPDAPGRVYTAAGDGYAVSTDGGDSWTHPQEGLDHRYVWGLAVTEDDPDTVVVSAASGPRYAHAIGGSEAYIYRRTDGGAWERVMDGLPDPEGTVRSVLAASRGSTVYALNNRGLYRSRSAGASWDRLPVEWSDAYEEGAPCGIAVV